MIAPSSSSAASLDPSDPRARLQTVHALALAGRIDEASTAAQAMLADGIDHPVVLSLVAGWHERRGDDRAALALLHRAHAQAPDAPGILNPLGLCLHRLGQYDEAIRVFSTALAADPSFTPARTNRGHAFIGAARLNAAGRDFEEVLAVEPENPLALTGLATLALRRGDAASAETCARRVLARQPAYQPAELLLAQAELAAGKAGAAEQRLLDLTNDPDLPEHDRGIAYGVLGDACDTQRRFAEAWDAWEQSASCFRNAHRAFAATPPQALLDTLSNQLRQLRASPRPFTPEAGPASRHVFLVGFPRSGTTLLEQVLEQHPAVTTLAEKECLVDAAARTLSNGAQLVDLYSASNTTLESIRSDYWRRVEAEGVDPAGQVFVDKHPFHSFKLPLIARAFPDATILLIDRDPRDTVLSCFRRRFALNPVTYQFLSAESAAQLYVATKRLQAETLRVFRPTVLSLQLEEIVADLEGETRRICSALGLAWDPAMLDFASDVVGRGVFTPSGPQLARGLNAEGIGRWRDYATELAPAIARLDQWTGPASHG